VYTSNKPGTVPCACTTIKKVSRILGRTYDAALSSSGINVTQLAVLRCISRREGEPLARVARELELDRTSLYRAIDPMVRDGWLVIAEGTNARSRQAKITKKGTRILAKAAVGWDDLQKRMIEGFGDKAYGSLMSELNRLADCAESAGVCVPRNHE
jgi:DNA-binding MarR family transcriptional regulator